MKLKKVEELVLDTLEKYRATRRDDYLLYLVVLKRLGIDTRLQIQELFLNHKDYKLPAFESVTRCRRKIQETRQDLIDWSTAKIRKDKEEEFRAYSRKGV
jgi:hypothetical protein